MYIMLKVFKLYPIICISFFQEWSIKTTTGYPVRGGFGHSSVWDHITNRIYVYGGNISTFRKCNGNLGARLANDGSIWLLVDLG